MVTPRRNRATISTEWRKSPGRLTRELRFRDYECALRFAGLIGQIEDFGHHAELCIRHDLGGRLDLTIRNLNHAGLTEQEMRLARKLDAAISEHYDYAYASQPSTLSDVPPAPAPAVDRDIAAPLAEAAINTNGRERGLVQVA